MLPNAKIQALPGVNCWVMTMMVEKIAAVTLRVADMRRSVRFYGDVLGMEIVFGGEDAFSLRFAPRTAAPLSLI
jgi:catechol-2,3-dioxygenase